MSVYYIVPCIFVAANEQSLESFSFELGSLLHLRLYAFSPVDYFYRDEPSTNQINVGLAYPSYQYEPHPSEYYNNLVTVYRYLPSGDPNHDLRTADEAARTIYNKLKDDNRHSILFVNHTYQMETPVMRYTPTAS
jgi:hypothetical protein